MSITTNRRTMKSILFRKCCARLEIAFPNIKNKEIIILVTQSEIILKVNLSKHTAILSTFDQLTTQDHNGTMKIKQILVHDKKHYPSQMMRIPFKKKQYGWIFRYGVAQVQKHRVDTHPEFCGQVESKTAGGGSVALNTIQGKFFPLASRFELLEGFS